jgi:K+-sensing histidine kinase KdpD
MDKGEVDSDRQWFQKLKKLASDLQATGNEFSQLSSISTGTEGAAKTVEPISVASVVQQAWDEIEEQFIDGDLTLEQKGDDFNLAIERKDLLIAVLRVIQWMTQRADKIPAEVSTPIIEVEYAHHAGHWEIRFADHSRRLGSQLRQKLFDPFTQATTPMVSIKEEGEEHLGLYLPLYLAKTLIEVKNNGSLEDRSDEREDRYGHLFVMSFAVEEENNSKAEKV